MKEKLIRILKIYGGIILIINLSFWLLVGIKFSPVETLYDDGLVLKIKPFNYAMVFAHGNYKWNLTISNCTNSNETYFNRTDHYHFMTLDGESYKTKDFVEALKAEGYNHVWGSWCNSGNEEYMIKYENGTEIEWYDWVSRNEYPGMTTPVFLGFAVVRIPGDYIMERTNEIIDQVRYAIT